VAINSEREVELLLEDLFHMISDAKSFPISAGKCIVDRNGALDIIDMIRAQLPREIEEARRLVAGRKKFITNAQKEAELIKKTAEERSRQLIDEQEVLRAAQAESRDLLADANMKSSEMKRQAAAYVGDTLVTTETTLREALGLITRSREMYQIALEAMDKQEKGPALLNEESAQMPEDISGAL